jgi:hypothetical protein
MKITLDYIGKSTSESRLTNWLIKVKRGIVKALCVKRLKQFAAKTQLFLAAIITFTFYSPSFTWKVGIG